MANSFEIATIGLSPRGRLGISGLPGLNGTFDQDLEALLSWHPSIVVSMTEILEMRETGAEELGEMLERHNVCWLHLPLSDYQGLAGANAVTWDKSSAKLHSELDAGKGILVHCRGGHGRSGMIALRLMVERGEEPEAALKRLRAVRPGAIETKEQMRWASAFTDNQAARS